MSRFRTKLTDKQRQTIIELYDNKSVSVLDIGRRFGIGKTGVRKIWNEVGLPPRKTDRCA